MGAAGMNAADAMKNQAHRSRPLRHEYAAPPTTTAIHSDAPTSPLK